MAEFSGGTTLEIVDNLPPKGPKKGQKMAFCNCLFSRYHLLTKFYSSSYQILTKFYFSRRLSEFVNNFFRTEFGAALLEAEFSVAGALWIGGSVVGDMDYKGCGFGRFVLGIRVLRVVDFGFACCGFGFCVLWFCLAAVGWGCGGAAKC